MSLNIYLAGKISNNDWRFNLVDGLSYKFSDGICGSLYEFNQQWPIMERSIFGQFDYSGPYFVSCDHGCFHGKNTHGVSPKKSHLESLIDKQGNNVKVDYLAYWRNKDHIQQLCLDAIKRSDLIFAWIDSPDCYGTIAELGYAKALGKEMCIAGPKMFDDMWFVYRLTEGIWGEYPTPSSALKSFIRGGFGDDSYIDQLREVTESPIEKMFFDRAILSIPPIAPQYQIGRYRVDFALPKEKVVVEIDGHDYHKTKEQRTRDAKRQRELEIMGWRVIRFTGSEVYKDVNQCVKDTLDILETMGIDFDDFDVLT